MYQPFLQVLLVYFPAQTWRHHRQDQDPDHKEEILKTTKASLHSVSKVQEIQSLQVKHLQKQNKAPKDPNLVHFCKTFSNFKIQEKN